MHGVLADRLGEQFADGAFSGLGRVGGAHHVAVFRNGVFAFQDLHDHRAGDHEVNEFAEERTLAVHAVEALSLGARHLDAALGDDAQAGLFDHGIDGAGEVTLGGVRLDDRECTLHGHGGFLNLGFVDLRGL